jgi:uncharacterized protein YnzC (UPF0291/DUF896 family)
MANVQRINELAKIAKERELTPEELQERARLREEYIQEFRRSFSAQLDNTVIRRPDGTEERVADRNKGKK